MKQSRFIRYTVILALAGILALPVLARYSGYARAQSSGGGSSSGTSSSGALDDGQSPADNDQDGCPDRDKDCEPRKVCALKNKKGGYNCVSDTYEDTECSNDACKFASLIFPGHSCERIEVPLCLLNPVFPPYDLPTGPPVPPQQPPKDLGLLIGNIFNFSLQIIGIAMFVMILFGGFEWLTAAGNPGKITVAKGRIYNAILGGILLLSTYVILNTINPDFVQQKQAFPSLPPVTKPLQ